MHRMTLTLALALLCGTALADEATELRGRYLPEVDPGVITSGFLAAHPDLAGRQKGMLALDRNEPEVAARHLLAASRYGDKPSQAVLGELYWEGRGVPKDPVSGYLWMYLASLNGYKEFIYRTNVYWNAMDPGQRQQVQQRGPDFIREYGDEASGKRLARVLGRGSREATGSMLGGSQGGVILTYDGSRPRRIDPEKFYASQYWEPDEYRQMQDTIWQSVLGEKVTVGELQAVRDGAAAKPPEPSVASPPSE